MVSNKSKCDPDPLEMATTVKTPLPQFFGTSVSGRLTPPLTPLTTPAHARCVRKKLVTYTFSLHCYIDINTGGRGGGETHISIISPVAAHI